MMLCVEMTIADCRGMLMSMAPDATENAGRDGVGDDDAAENND